jgi:ABC-type sugar transport system ATPase subunit
MAQVLLKGVKKSFGDTQVVRGVDLEVRDGELLIVVGASGCGKSTLLRLLAGLEEPSEGEIWIGDRLVNAVPPKDRDIAMVFQSYALYPHMTVRENMGFGLAVRGTPKPEIDRAVDEAARILGLTELLDRLPRAMSGGQRQRVAMGRAIVRRPKVFLFDEPLSNLDAALRAQMRVDLKKLHQQLGVTTFYVTHDQVEAMTLADRIVLLHQGRVQQVGTPDELFDWPVNQYTASFLGSPGMNFATGSWNAGLFEAPGLRLPVERSFLQREPSARVVAGVRPHAVSVRPAEGEIRGVVEVLEPMGWETHAHLRVGELPWTVRLSADEARALVPGGPVTLGVASRAVRLFDAADGSALCRRPA